MNRNTLKIILLFLIVLFSSCFSNSYSLSFDSKKDIFINDDKPLFPIGWYLTNTESIINTIIKNKSYSGFTDPFSDYYNTFLIYSGNHYNKENSHLDLDIKKIHSYLNNAVGNKFFIVSLPRYSTLYRTLFLTNSKEKKDFKSEYADYYTADNYLNKIIGNEKLYLYKNEKEPVSYIYDFSEFDDNFCILNVEKYFFTYKYNASIYRNADILNFSLKTLSYSSDVLIKILLENDHSKKALWICSSNTFLANSNANNILGNPDSVIIIDINKWNAFSINISKTINKKPNMTITGLTIIGKNILLGPISFLMDSEKSIKIIDYIVSELKDYNNILGFYTVDELEYKEILNSEKWAYFINGKRESGLKNGKILDLIIEENEIIKQYGFTPFNLSTAGYSGNNKFFMNENEYDELRKPVYFFDTYSYKDDYINALIESKKRADNLGSGVIIVNDAYSNKNRKALSFYLTKFKFFSSLIFGANGMLFYSYSSPVTDNHEEFKNDSNKQNVGQLSEFFYKYGLNDMYLHYHRSVINNELNIGSLIMNDSLGRVCFLYTNIKGHENYYNPCSTKEMILTFENDNIEISEIKKILEDKEYFIIDISPYSENKAFPKNGFSFFSEYNYVSKDNVTKVLNSPPFNTLFHPYDIRIIMFIPIDFNNNYSYFDYSHYDNFQINIFYPQLIENNHLDIKYNDQKTSKSLITSISHLPCFKDNHFVKAKLHLQGNINNLIINYITIENIKRKEVYSKTQY